MRTTSFEKVATDVDNLLCNGGLHFLVGVTGTGKSSICEIIKMNNKSDATFFDIQTDVSEEGYKKLASDIENAHTNIFIDGLVLYKDLGANVFDSVLKHIDSQRLGVVITTQSLNDLSPKYMSAASSVTLIANVYPRKENRTLCYSTDFTKDIGSQYGNLDEFWKQHGF